MKTKLFFLFLMLTSIGAMFASTKIGNLYYNLNATNHTAEVTSQSSSYPYWSTTIHTANIPGSVTYNSVSYSVTSIGNYAFWECKGLTSVTIPNSVTSIGQYAFCACSGFTSVTIPNSVTSIGNEAFYGCDGLTSINVASDNSNYCSVDGVLFNKDKTTLIQYPGGKQGAYTIPNSVTSIGEGAFVGCSGLTSIEIPNSVTSIGNYAFRGCSGLTSIEIPNSVTSIGNYAFQGCSGFTSVTIPNSVTSIGESAFYRCTGLTSVTIEAEIPPTLRSWAFSDTNDCPIYVPCSTLDAFKTAWSNYASRIQYAPLPDKITTHAENGNVDIASLGNYTTCDEQPYYSLTVIPNYGYHFTQWSDGNTDNPRTFVLTQDTTFVAEFAPNQYSVNVTCDEIYGHIEGDNGKFDYLTTHEYKAVANYGYHFDRWSDGETKNPRTIVLKQDSTITAEFKPNKYKIQDGSNSNQGYINGTGSFDYLSERTITAINQYGYHFTNWSDGSTDNPRTITLTQDTTFTAIFAIDKSGVCGLNNELVWAYEDKTKTLTISGNGALTSNYTFGVEAPTQMQNLIIGNEITAIGSRAFYAKSTINHLIIGGNVASIGDYAFAECKNFDDITCYATNVPTISDKTFNNVGNKQYIYLFVPENRERAYKRDVNWGEFDIQVQSAESTTTNDEVTVVPADNTADITWPAVNGADTYDIEITKDGERICVLTFNANGQLVGIAFAPGRNGKKQTQAAGFKFTVTGLTSCTTYGYKIASKNASGGTINTKSGSFTTTGEPQGIEDILSPEKATKVLRNGQILILRGEKTYTLQGQEVK